MEKRHSYYTEIPQKNCDRRIASARAGAPNAGIDLAELL
jgi:hypothetical protein